MNFGRDLPEPQVADIRNVVAGDPSPDGKGTLEIARGIEVGHIFQLRTKYSEAMNAAFLDEGGQARPFEMGCYGIGVTRIVAAAIEQNHDERGIIWPEPDRALPGRHRADRLPQERGRAALLDALRRAAAAGIEVLLDDRDERPGVMFADLELIGIPHRVAIGDRGLEAGKAEYKCRRDGKPQMIERRRARVPQGRADEAMPPLAVTPAPAACGHGGAQSSSRWPTACASAWIMVGDQRPRAWNSPRRRGLAWLDEMYQRLAPRIPDRQQSLELLSTVQYEAPRARLDPQLVLGPDRGREPLRKYAVSRGRARLHAGDALLGERVIGQPEP